MTEVIEILKEVNANYFQPDKEGEFDDVNKALDVAIQALEEIEQYRALGTVEELKEAREKQIPKKITRRYMKNINGDVIATSCYCPICDEYLQEEYPEYCSNCGQALKWGEEDD